MTITLLLSLAAAAPFAPCAAQAAPGGGNAERVAPDAVLAGAAPVAIQDAIDESVIGIHGFETSHPDMRFRALGVQARKDGRFEQARTYFRIAARYSDKLSQAALGEMLWEGEGGGRDRAFGYAWMDLAAERGTPWLLARRELYWSTLDAAGRKRAVSEGRAIYDAYGDDVAKPRLAHLLRTGRNAATGSRLGWIGNGLRIYNTNSASDAATGHAGAYITADDYYADRYWKPEAYFSWQDRVLRTAPREEHVDVGALQNVPDAGVGP